MFLKEILPSYRDFCGSYELLNSHTKKLHSDYIGIIYISFDRIIEAFEKLSRRSSIAIYLVSYTQVQKRGVSRTIMLS